MSVLMLIQNCPVCHRGIYFGKSKWYSAPAGTKIPCHDQNCLGNLIKVDNK